MSFLLSAIDPGGMANEVLATLLEQTPRRSRRPRVGRAAAERVYASEFAQLARRSPEQPG